MCKRGMHVRVRGIVQGVGFRPWIHRMVEKYRLCGWVRNTGFGAELELEGEEEALESFLGELSRDIPPLAEIEAVEKEWYTPLHHYTEFRIAASRSGERRDTMISPDICTCEDCRRELLDPSDRRYRYPFINCTNCGPRFTIIRDIPYDRKNTAMAAFPMCGTCRAEYEDIRSRRYHAEPDCCPDCGPRLFYEGEGRTASDEDALEAAAQLLLEGKILAVKGLGGFHLACRADLPETVRELRRRKHREEKPFALMCADVEAAREICTVSAAEEQLLLSRERPIVLLGKKVRGPADPCADISENGRIGVMLPYTPIHMLLLTGTLRTLVMTSANRSDLPVIRENTEARSALAGIADGFLLHDRDIHVRCDDSVVWEWRGHPYFARRSRGYVPAPVLLRDAGQEERRCILALGAEQKASFCISRGRHTFPSQHIGDLKNMETLAHYEDQIRHFETLFQVRPEMLVCDLHPDYLSTRYGEEQAAREQIPLLRVQHHYAHMCSCMADNGLAEPVIGIVWDGTGLGTDGTSWGGEFLTGDFDGFVRRGSIRRMRLPGGDLAARELLRIAAALLAEAGESAAGPEIPAVYFRQLAAGVNCPESSSIGRLFDGVSALLGIRETAGYEGQGAILLEAAAEMTEETEETLPWEIARNGALEEYDWRPTVRALIKEKAAGRQKEILAAMFMNTLTGMAAEMVRRIREETGIRKAVLSGGCFQNIYLLKRLTALLEAEGLEVFTHRRVSANDEGIALGQLAIAERRRKQE